MPMRSWSMNRPTRVPASTVVRMKRASNMIAKWYQNACNPPRKAVAPAKIWDIPTASVGAPPVREMMLDSPTLAARVRERIRADREPEARDGRRRRLRGAAGQGRGRVHREVEARVEDAGGDQGHDCNEGFHEHRPVADHAHLRLFLDELRGGAGGDKRVEARERPAGDCYEHEREERADGRYRSTRRGEGELSKAWHLHGG